METNQTWIIKDENSNTELYFSMLGSPHFTTNFEIAQRFNSERDAILCQEQYIDTDVNLLDHSGVPVQLND